MQAFSYHSHTNSFDIFDGRFSAKEMVKKAEEIGYTELGISNHLCYHPNQSLDHPMFFNDYDKMEAVMLRLSDEVREAGAQSKIKVLFGFEVDFFPSLRWRADFDKFVDRVKADYYIGSTHFLRNDDETEIVNIYTYKYKGRSFSQEKKEQYIKTYWNNISEAIKSGYFDFIAHLDVYRLFDDFKDIVCPEELNNLLDTFEEYKTPYELNTSGWRKYGEQHPNTPMLEELQKRGVPVVISDDAHSLEHLGGYYKEAEELLKKMNYTNRWKLNK